MKIIKETERVYAVDDDGHEIGEMTFPLTTRGYHNINYTEVSEEYEGQGIGQQLGHAAAAVIRDSGKEAVATCPFAMRFFQTHPEEADILRGHKK